MKAIVDRAAHAFMEYLTNTAAEFGASYITVSADLQNEPAHQVYLSWISVQWGRVFDIAQAKWLK